MKRVNGIHPEAVAAVLETLYAGAMTAAQVGQLTYRHVAPWAFVNKHYQMPKRQLTAWANEILHELNRKANRKVKINGKLWSIA